ncbi:unnamed protein product [Sphagnum balticum]
MRGGLRSSRRGHRRVHITHRNLPPHLPLAAVRDLVTAAACTRATLAAKPWRTSATYARTFTPLCTLYTADFISSHSGASDDVFSAWREQKQQVNCEHFVFPLFLYRSTFVGLSTS